MYPGKLIPMRYLPINSLRVNDNAEYDFLPMQNVLRDNNLCLKIKSVFPLCNANLYVPMSRRMRKASGSTRAQQI